MSDDIILTALAGVTERLTVLESSQRVRDEKEWMMGAVEKGMFASKLGAKMRGRPMTIDAHGPPGDRACIARQISVCPTMGRSSSPVGA
uniref:Uncharacterized protein n=1 Tax=Peronospora matthiolae TaxID=2874970 RepID=A0AAV1T469_9STRA